MSGLDRRVQILVEPDQYSALEREASRTGRSVAAVIRDSITEHLAARRPTQAAAADRLLAAAVRETGPGEDWSDTKDALDRDLLDKLP